VTARRNAQQAIYLDDEDREQFLAVLGRVVPRFHLLPHAYCLMDNHFHLLVETPEANLSQSMRQLNGVYTQAFNHCHQPCAFSIAHVFVTTLPVLIFATKLLGSRFYESGC